MDFQSDYHLLHENKWPPDFYWDFSSMFFPFFSVDHTTQFNSIAKCILSHFLDLSSLILFYSILFSVFVRFVPYFAYSISVRWTILLHCSIIKCIHWKITIYLSILYFVLRIFFLLDILNKIDQSTPVVCLLARSFVRSICFARYSIWLHFMFSSVLFIKITAQLLTLNGNDG